MNLKQLEQLTFIDISTMPMNHAVREPILFWDRSILDTLSTLVQCSLKPPVSVYPTGIFPHVSLLREISKVTAETAALTTAISNSGRQIVSDLTLMLEKRAIGARTVTRSRLQELLSSELERFLGNRGVEIRVQAPDSQSAERIQSQLFKWGSGLRRLPQDFSLPAGNVVAAFRSWMLPDTSNNICALKNCTSSEFYCNNKKKQFNDYSVLMRLIKGGYSGLNPSAYI